MKKTMMFIAVIAMLLLSCEKEECNCGTIANDGIDNGCYWLEIRNDCSGNKKKFCFDEDIWTNNFVGDRFCVSNVTSW
jgi:hypothetical protein